MKKSLKTLLSVILTAAMLLTVMLPAFAATGAAADGKTHFNLEKVDNGKGSLRNQNAMAALPEELLSKDNVRVSIVLKDAPVLEKGFSARGIAANKKAMQYRASLQNKQAALAESISAKALGGDKLNVKWNLTLAANIISAEVPGAAIAKIEKLPGVAKVVVERQYEPAVVSKGGDEPNMATAGFMTGASGAWAVGYTGAGSKVAIIDTGIDTDHISFDASAFEYAVSQAEADVDLLTAEEVAAVYSELNIAAALPEAAAAAYVSGKIPFALNYVDGDLDITHDNDKQGEHGSHVAGIAAANRFIANGDGTFANAIEAVQTQGVAPDAQLLVMKVFGKGGGAYDSDYFAAIEDAVLLGADSINLSLGSASAGFAADDTYQDILDNFQSYDAVVSISAGNAGAWADESTYGVLLAEDNNFDTVGSPGSFANAFTVASVDNDGSTGPYITMGDRIIFYTETYDYDNDIFVTLAGDRNFVYVDAFGEPADFAPYADLISGNIAICNRGSTSFFEKVNAAALFGASGVIIANNQPGTISMNLTGITTTIPAVSITKEDADYIKENAQAVTDGENNVLYYTGSFTVSSNALIQEAGEVDYHTMSSFSSFGVPGDLSLKPEITAPGGNIYSVNGKIPGGTAYENMSGTSMAAPHIAGLTAVLAQYIRENGLAEKTGLTVRQLTQSLLMSTADPMSDADGYPYAVFQQGAGLANINSAINAKSYILMDDKWDYAADGKVKAELGEDAERTGEYDIPFTLNNFSDSDLEYVLEGAFFTQWIRSGMIRDISTDMLGADVTWTVNGEEYEPLPTQDYDFNGNGLSNTADVQYLLDYITGSETMIFNPDAADYDGDEDIDTFDAFEIYKLLTSVAITAPAGESVAINAHVVLDPDDIGYYDYNGNYVEGYIFVGEVDSADGALGVVHNIPVLGYYGSFTEAPMTDMDYIDYMYDLADFAPYVNYAQAFLLKYAGDSDAYVLGGNPMFPLQIGEEYDEEADEFVPVYDYDDVYLPERNAINSENGSTIAGVQSVLIRNAAAARFTVTDEEGNNLMDPVITGAKYGAYYYASQGKWMNTSTTVNAPFDPSGLKEGDSFTLSVSYAPEYYVNEDGEVDWDALGAGAASSITASVDNTAPEILDAYVTGYDTETCAWDTFEVMAQDNGYIALIAIFNDQGDLLGYSKPDYDAAAGEKLIFTLTSDELAELDLGPQTKLLVEVYDYAANATSYKMNLDLADLENEVTVSIDEAIALVPNNSAKINVTVEPWGTDESVTWTSSDETVATVDANGVVTGVAEGECDVTAVSAADPQAKAVCHVTVKNINKDLNAVIWDENGEVWLSAFNTSTIPAYEKLTAESLRKEIASIAYGGDGTLYAASFDSEEWVSDLYTVDPETFEFTMVGSSSIGYMDLCSAYAIGTDYLYAVYGSYLVVVDATTGDYLGVFDLSEDAGGNYFVGIAYEEFYPLNASTALDILLLMDEAGNLYEIGISNNFGSTDLYPIVNCGYATDTPYFNSLYFDGTSAFWSRFNAGDSYVDLIDIDLYDTGSIFNLGSFEQDVWPVGGLFELEPADPSGVSDPGARGEIKIVKDMINNIEPIEITAVAAVKGTLNADPADPTDPTDPAEPVSLVKTVELTAADAATNGLITVRYDCENYTLTDVRTAAPLYSVMDYGPEYDIGQVTFAYITKDGAPYDKDAVVATLYFTAVDEEAAAEELVQDITTQQINNDHAHNYIDDEWIWTETEDGYTAALSLVCLEHDDEEPITVEATVEKEVVEPTCTRDGSVTYTATANCEGEIFTDVRTEPGDPAAGHSWDEGEVISEATCAKGGSIVYTCTVCGAKKTSPVASGHLYKVAAWNWNEDLSACTVDLVCERDASHTTTAEAEVSVVEILSTFTKNGCLIYTATYGDESDEKVTVYDTGLHQAMTAANDWAADTGLDAFITGSDTNGKDNTAEIAINVDGIWSDASLDNGTFDGFMTAFGKAITDTFGDADVTINGNAVYADGKLQNTAVKNALFDIGAGFFYKIANLGDDGVYGVYNVTVNDEPVVLTVKLVGSDANLAKVKEFAAVIAEHISADVVDGNLVIDVIAPDQLVNAIAGMYHGDETVAEKLKSIELGAGFNMLPKDASGIFGSQVSAVNKLCAFLCKLNPLVNKVLEKITEATVTLADGTNVALLDGAFAPAGESYADLLNAVIAALSDELLAKTVGDFTEEDGVYTVPVNVSVDMANLGIMAGSTIQETVIFNLHLFDNCAHPETLPIEAVAPTCTEAGATAGSYCRICGKTVDAPKEIPALGHDFDESIEANVTVVPATCTEKGSKTVKCSRCDATKVTETAAAGHILEKVEAKEATVTEEGNIEYYKCSVCGKLFADAEGKTELQPEDVVIAKLAYYRKGDVNLDNNISTADARLALRVAIGLENYAKDSEPFYNADINDDGEVKTGEARDILRVAIGLDTPDWAAWWLNADQD